MKKEEYKKSPHYFKAHFYERYTSVNKTPHMYGKPFVIVCDRIAVNVYGFSDEEEAKAYDPIKLRGLLIGKRNLWMLITADTEAEAMEIIANMQQVKDGVYWLNTEERYGALENLPTCNRMYVNGRDDEFCGKPENEHGDGSIGGCIIDGNQQDDDVLESYGCPLLKYFEEREEKRKSAISG